MAGPVSVGSSWARWPSRCCVARARPSSWYAMGTRPSKGHERRRVRPGRRRPLMYKRVLVTLDGSPLAEAILPFITEIAGPLDMEVVLLEVLAPLPVGGEDVEWRLAEAREYLSPLAAELTASGVRTRIEVRHGHPVEEIVGCAQALGADLIAMTTHGRSGLGRVLFGSVAGAVLRQADVHVFLMRLTVRQLRTPAAATVR